MNEVKAFILQYKVMGMAITLIFGFTSALLYKR